MNRRQFLAVATATAVAAGITAAVADPVFQNFRGHAIRGYDPVGYFTEGRPVEGRAEHSLEWNGATWRFASAQNRALFEANPERYAPQYGGYCAWAVAQGYTASIDPEAWDIVEGRLFLNYSKDVQRQWREDRGGHITRADGNWPEIARKLGGG
jgi:YHS domain-containing protein